MDDLAAFAVLVDAGSFTLAAQQLGCSKGQLSKRISHLEAQFAVVLLHRTTRRLSLTAAGAALLPQAQALVVQVERARQATVPVSLGETFFDGLLLEFSRDYPDVQIELDLSNNFRDLLREGFDLAIRTEVGNDERLVARPLLVMNEMTCASPAYLERYGEPRTPQELAQHHCLLNSHYSGREEWQYHRQHELVRVRVGGPLRWLVPVSPACRPMPWPQSWLMGVCAGCCVIIAPAICRPTWCIRTRAGCPDAPRCWPIIWSVGSSAAARRWSGSSFSHAVCKRVMAPWRISRPSVCAGSNVQLAAWALSRAVSSRWPSSRTSSRSRMNTWLA